MPFGLPDSDQKLSYGGYLRVRDLLALQQLRSDPPQHDEMLFIVIHQVYELWFKQLLHEGGAIRRAVETDALLEAARLLRRAVEIERVLVAQLAVLKTMTPTAFLAFRDHLMPASGFQSAQFRELEYLVGLKEPKFLQYYAPGSPERAVLERRLGEPSLRDALHDLLRRRQLSADAAGVAQVYRGPERYRDLFLLLEELIEFDETFTVWRLRHVQMVERIIGGRQGTGGSAGAAYLRSTTDRRMFPELWEARNLLDTHQSGS